MLIDVAGGFGNVRKDPGFTDSSGQPRYDVEPTPSSSGWVLAVDVVASRLEQMGV